MMKFLAIPEGGKVKVNGCNLPKGVFVKFKPRDKKFYDITNPRAVFVFF